MRRRNGSARRSIASRVPTADCNSLQGCPVAGGGSRSVGRSGTHACEEVALLVTAAAYGGEQADKLDGNVYVVIRSEVIIEHLLCARHGS